MTLYVLPAFPLDDSLDSGCRNIKNLSESMSAKFRKFRVQPSDDLHVMGRQFRHLVAFPRWHLPLFSSLLHIFGMRPNTEMIWINAGRVVSSWAIMKDIEAMGDLSISYFPGNTMGLLWASFRWVINLSITMGFGPHPDPASVCFSDEPIEPIRERNSFRDVSAGHTHFPGAFCFWFFAALASAEVFATAFIPTIFDSREMFNNHYANIAYPGGAS